LDTQDIVRSQRICKETGRLYKTGFTKWFNIYRHLSHFFDDPNLFRYCQARTGAIVAGSSVLEFLLRDTFAEASLDIYVHQRAKGMIGTSLLNNGYMFLASEFPFSDATSDDGSAETGDSMRNWGVVGVLIFERMREGTKRRVRMIVVDGTPLKIIMESHSTCALNFFTFDTIYCLYPRATLVEKKSLLLKDMNDAEPRARSEVQGYQRNGYHFLELAEEDNTGLFQLQKVRWATDHHSWSFKL
ncbi:hypothetical protein BC629DRAFT_1260380, partial [Irpex lacteus]